MKIKFDIDITPQELRTFFGLPDLEPIQKEMLDIVRHNIHSGMEGFDAVELMKPLLPQHLQTLEAFRNVWRAFQANEIQGNRNEPG